MHPAALVVILLPTSTDLGLQLKREKLQMFEERIIKKSFHLEEWTKFIMLYFKCFQCHIKRPKKVPGVSVSKLSILQTGSLIGIKKIES